MRRIERGGRGECHFLLTNSPRRLFFIPPLLLVIAQSSHIHPTGHFYQQFHCNSLTSVFQVQHYYWYFFSISAASNHPPPVPCVATPTPPLCSLWEGDLCQASSGKTERQTTGLTMTWGHAAFTDINSAVWCQIKWPHLSVPSKNTDGCQLNVRSRACAF